MPEQPKMVMVCGSNGAGKSTLTYRARAESGDTLPFLDPDRIAKEQQCSPIMAGKIVTSTIKKYIEAGQGFVRESTLTANFDFQSMRAAKEKGFHVTLHYVGIGSADDAVARVKQRHADGGHTVPEEDIRRRYERSLENLPEAIKQADLARILDNSGNDYNLIAVFERGRLVSHTSTPPWFQKTLEKLQNREALEEEEEELSGPGMSM